MQLPQSNRDLISSIGVRVRDARKQRKLTQKEFAGVANLHVNVISAIEAGTSKNPRQETLVKIAAAIGIPLAELEGTAGAKPPVVQFLDDFREKSPDLFAQWPEPWKEVMWRRFIEIATKMGITTEYGATKIINTVSQELACIQQFLEISDRDRAAAIITFVSAEYARMNQSTQSAFSPRIDQPHVVPDPHATLHEPKL